MAIQVKIEGMCLSGKEHKGPFWDVGNVPYWCGEFYMCACLLNNIDIMSCFYIYASHQ